jgi:hypothetical protein
MPRALPAKGAIVSNSTYALVYVASDLILELVGNIRLRGKSALDSYTVKDGYKGTYSTIVLDSCLGYVLRIACLKITNPCYWSFSFGV